MSSKESHKYIWIKCELANEIREGGLRSHDRLPSERSLSERYNVSRSTARLALIQLEKEGLAYTKNRSSRFVAEPQVDYDLSTTVSFFATGFDRKGEVEFEVLYFEALQASDEEASALQVEGGAKIYKYSRLFRLAGKLAFIEEEYVSSERFPDLKREHLERPLIPYFESAYGVKASHDKVAITMESFPAEIAQKLELTPPCAGILLEQLVLDSNHKPISVARQYWRGDVAHFSGTIMR